MKLKVFVCAFLILSSLAPLCHALVTGKSISMSVGGDFLADDLFSAPQSIKIRCGQTFSGSGKIDAPEIELTVKKFTFTGTINCSTKCTIKAQEAFDTNMFKREGSGEFVIIIDPTLDFTLQPFKMPALPSIPAVSTIDTITRENITRAPRGQVEAVNIPTLPTIYSVKPLITEKITPSTVEQKIEPIPAINNAQESLETQKPVQIKEKSSPLTQLKKIWDKTPVFTRCWLALAAGAITWHYMHEYKLDAPIKNWFVQSYKKLTA